MARTEAFDRYSEEYDEWFVSHDEMYRLELEAVRALMPEGGHRLEVGVGTGKFAIPLGIRVGVEPSEAMARVARQAGVDVRSGTAGELPFDDGVFDVVLMVTTICFVDDPRRSLAEAHRVLKEDGVLIVAFVDRESRLGKEYLEKRNTSRFYGEATFYSSGEIVELMRSVGFGSIRAKQTLITGSDGMEGKVLDGYGSGCFVAIRGTRNGSG